MPERFIGDGYWELISRQMSIVTKSEQTRFKDSKIAVVGCGGIGGEAIEMLARMGVGKLNLIDKDSFDISNLNRQTMSSLDTIKLSKSEVSKERIRLINPYTEVTAFNEELNENNMKKVLGNCDIIIDALDNIYTRILISRFAKENKIPFIHGAIHGTMGQLTVFMGDLDYERMFSLPSTDKELTESIKKEISKLAEEIPPAIGPVPNIVGCLEAIEAFKILTNIGEVIKAPKILSFDLLNLNSFKITEL